MRALDGSLLGEMIVKRGIFFQEKGRRLNNHADAYVLIFLKRGIWAGHLVKPNLCSYLAGSRLFSSQAQSVSAPNNPS
jgi:hypothetical protein